MKGLKDGQRRQHVEHVLIDGSAPQVGRICQMAS